ncbi:uncharacterized protein DSM5745_08611 [Aspergillus mulundensis]|uniref:Major facilitator superfamily (MFS) profile domain-containing protein n=1 Tax=Aspergillus mulundensis TaxID=1810919 RepID=A0A3D8R4J7_9EURO|nr:hypothetical protein DSM5745_08611 [Aspergillus mulundensis]RDW68851.1 hypothetical protein DSM5745_08611 [Aspergillus mulundensis]
MSITGYALVVGGEKGTGIGRACALTLAKAGAEGILIADINVTAASETARLCTSMRLVANSPISFLALATHVDITDQGSVDAAVSAMIERFGHMDYCVNCAGIGPNSHDEIADADTGAFKQMLDVDVTGTFHVIREASRVFSATAGSRGAAWFGSLVNGPIADRFGRKMLINLAVVVFVIRSAIQCSATNIPMIFAGRAVAGLAVAGLAVPCVCLAIPSYLSSSPLTLTVSVTIGILVSYWIDYGTNCIGGTRCAPDVPYAGSLFDPYIDVPETGCTGQSEASWRLSLAIQIAPAVILGIGMLFFPDSPRWLLMTERDDEALSSLSRLRRQATDSSALRSEYLEIRASIMLENSFAREKFPGLSGVRLHAA